MEIVALVTIGLFAGLLGGLLGIGGSVLIIPGLILVFGQDQHLYQGAAMMVNFCVAAPAAYAHYRARGVLPSVVNVMVAAGLVSVLAGVWLSARSWFRGENEVYLARIFGAFLVYVVVYNIWRLRSTGRLTELDHEKAQRIPQWRIASAVGMPMGLLAGLLGIGGGSLAVPLQQVFLKMPLRQAIGNSSATIVALSFTGAIYKNYSNARMGIPFSEALNLAIVLIPSAILGGYVGAKLTHRIPRRALRIALIVMLSYAAFELFERTAAPEASQAQLLRGTATSQAIAGD